LLFYISRISCVTFVWCIYLSCNKENPDLSLITVSLCLYVCACVYVCMCVCVCVRVCMCGVQHLTMRKMIFSSKGCSTCPCRRNRCLLVAAPYLVVALLSLTISRLDSTRLVAYYCCFVALSDVRHYYYYDLRLLLDYRSASQSTSQSTNRQPVASSQ
jgi:hypothetical protein